MFFLIMIYVLDVIGNLLWWLLIKWLPYVINPFIYFEGTSKYGGVKHLDLNKLSPDTGRNLIKSALTQPVDLIFFALNLLDLVMLINCLSK